MVISMMVLLIIVIKPALPVGRDWRHRAGSATSKSRKYRSLARAVSARRCRATPATLPT